METPAQRADRILIALQASPKSRWARILASEFEIVSALAERECRVQNAELSRQVTDLRRARGRIRDIVDHTKAKTIRTCRARAEEAGAPETVLMALDLEERRV